MNCGGIIGYGTYLPNYRITLETMASAQQEDLPKLFASLGVTEKTVAGYDEDAITMAVSAAEQAIITTTIDRTNIGAIYVGSESHPYAVKPSAAIVGTALGIGRYYTAADIEFACKGGTAALHAALAMVRSSLAPYALAIGCDVAQAHPNDILAYVAAAGSAAFLIGNNANEVIATVDASHSITVDLPDFWRRAEQRYPEHTGRFTGQPAYFSIVEQLVTSILNDNNLTTADIDYVVFHQPNAKFVTAIAKQLGFNGSQYETGMIVQTCGNCYSATTLLGLAAVLDQAQPGKRILVASFGSGAGGDAFIMTTTSQLPRYQQQRTTFIKPLQQKKYLSFLEYQRITAMRPS
ncbi:MAG: hydroxymethylglutaryl-CoA synthase [Candidatus Babeliales bacterium]